VHALHCGVAQRSRLIPLSVSPNSGESGKQSLYPDGDPDRHQKFNQWFIGPLPTVPKIHANPFLRKVANRQTDKQRPKQNLLGGGN